MIKERNIPLYLILSIFLFPVAWYWFIVVASDINELRGGEGPNGLLHFILGIRDKQMSGLKKGLSAEC